MQAIRIAKDHDTEMVSWSFSFIIAVNIFTSDIGYMTYGIQKLLTKKRQ